MSAAVETLQIVQGFSVLVSDKILEQIFNAFTCVLGRRTVAVSPVYGTGAGVQFVPGSEPKVRNKQTAEKIEGDTVNQLLREQEVKAGVLPLMQLFAGKSSAIGAKIRDSGLIERCQSQIETAASKIAQIEDYQENHLHEPTEVQVSHMYRSTVH